MHKMMMMMKMKLKFFYLLNQKTPATISLSVTIFFEWLKTWIRFHAADMIAGE
jgi:hypothetical protein